MDASKNEEEKCTRGENLQNHTNTSDQDLIKPSVGSRERRNISPSLNLNDVLPDPMSPSSSSIDTTFEPTIEMMVNDFDDEQTLNEEEALAALESQDPESEINQLKEESEIPLEEILAKYNALQPITAFLEPRKKKKSSKKRHKCKQNPELPSASEINEEENGNEGNNSKTDFTVIESSEEKDIQVDEEKIEDEFVNINNNPESPDVDSDLNSRVEISGIQGAEIHKVRRTHLLDLYPEGTFGNVIDVSEDLSCIDKDTPDGLEDEEEEDDEEYKKKVMIGPSYQALIPQGLSQYGDILPYENEDKLIWEPSQVTEREVEEYLLKIRDIKNSQGGEEEITTETPEDVEATKENGHNAIKPDTHNIENNSLLANGEKANSVTVGAQQQAGIGEDVPGVVKDNEQALHLLVQCGYDFKEALRRKRLNALHLPLNDCMRWSEEECQKFEEGIQKYGKDFLKIRQNQVRTRSHRELVQFYYLWKKSERRDHNFANADTVDHMDIYLNEDNEYGSNSASATTPMGSPVNANTSSANSTRRNSQMKNISIMSNHSVTANNSNSVANLDKNCINSQQKRRASANYSNLVSNDSSNSDNSQTPNPTNIATTK